MASESEHADYIKRSIWGKNSTKTHPNRKFKLYHVFTTFLLENRTFSNFLQLSGLIEFLSQRSINPILESLVTQVLLEKPDDTVSYICP